MRSNRGIYAWETHLLNNSSAGEDLRHYLVKVNPLVLFGKKKKEVGQVGGGKGRDLSLPSPNLGTPLLHLVLHSFSSARVTLRSATRLLPTGRSPRLSSGSPGRDAPPGPSAPLISSGGADAPPTPARAPPLCPKTPPPVAGKCQYSRPFGLRGRAGLLRREWELSQPLTVGGVGLE